METFSNFFLILALILSSLLSLFLAVSSNPFVWLVIAPRVQFGHRESTPPQPARVSKNRQWSVMLQRSHSNEGLNIITTCPTSPRRSMTSTIHDSQTEEFLDNRLSVKVMYDTSQTAFAKLGQMFDDNIVQQRHRAFDKNNQSLVDWVC